MVRVSEHLGENALLLKNSMLAIDVIMISEINVPNILH